jgi:CBS domain containing-hemolysin-like protein
VGSIRDEHEDENDDDGVIRDADGSWSIPGSLSIELLEELLGGELELPEDYEATTAAGLVSETAGRIPQAGEVIEVYGLRFEVLASTDRRIDRLRISRPEKDVTEK